tara:strand:+ start:461 stop:646 length:186 start_codon:yes stop_codon:yes gene_type:complete
MKKNTKKIGRPRSTIPMKKLTLSVPEEAWEKWAVQAKRERTTMSELAVRLLNQYLSKRKGR